MEPGGGHIRRRGVYTRAVGTDAGRYTEGWSAEPAETAASDETGETGAPEAARRGN